MSKVLKEMDIIKNLAKEVITEMKLQESEKQKKKVLHNTELLMKNYTKFKDHIDRVDDSIEYDTEIEEDIVFISSITRTKLRTAKMIAYIDSALEIIRKNMINSGEEYKYSAFCMYYLESQTNEDIMEKYNCGKNTPKRWRDYIITELSVLLWGIEALGF